MESETALKDWIRQHRVTWELGSWQEMVDGTPTTVGFELRLFAQHDPHAHPTPGCSHCVSLYEKLRAIALATLPKEHRPTRYDIEPFEPAYHLRPEGQWRPEVQLTLHLVHRDGYLPPMDACEKRCAEEIQQGLRKLGARLDSWSASRGS